VTPAIRLAEVGAGDWELVRDLRRRTLATDPDAFGSTLELEKSYDESAWRARIDRGRTVVAFLDGDPVGLGGAYDDEHGVTWVVAMWVEPAHRGRGIGTAVLDEVLAHAVPRAREVRLWVADGNAARHAYERAGFVPTGARAPIRPGATIWKAEMALPSGRSAPVDGRDDCLK
jgi:GNAT superfamily N-acetyltransferase